MDKKREKVKNEIMESLLKKVEEFQGSDPDVTTLHMDLLETCSEYYKAFLGDLNSKEDVVQLMKENFDLWDEFASNPSLDKELSYILKTYSFKEAILEEDGPREFLKELI